MGVTWSQFFPPAPTLTEKNLPRQDGKVFIITGGTSGIGLELAKILYHAGGRVYVASCSESNGEAAIAAIKASSATNSTGTVAFLPIVLDDLSTIRPAVDRFLAAESRLDVLFNNAGVNWPPDGVLSPQGLDVTMATDCLGPYLLTQLLIPILTRTSQTSSPGAVRVVWTSSIVTDTSSPIGGINLEELEKTPTGPQRRYENTKTGNWFLADSLSKQIGSKGVLCISQNPGFVRSNIFRNVPFFVPWVLSPILHHSRFGAYTELWAGLAPDLVIEDGGRYVLPWGRLHPSPRQDILEAMKTKEEGGTGVSALFTEYCERVTASYR